MNRFTDVTVLRQLCAANVVTDCEEDEAQQYLAKADILVQGLPAHGTCGAPLAIAQSLGATIDITFAWCRKEGAIYRGGKTQTV